MSQSNSVSGADLIPSAPRNDEYPPQLHAGAVGLGPEFGKGASTNDKFGGLKQEIKGKMKGDLNLVQQGRDLRTGESKRREMQEDHGLFGKPHKAYPHQGEHQEHAGQEQPDMKTTDEHPEDK